MDARVARIATDQLGLVTCAQAMVAGLSPTMIDTRVRSGRWELLYPGVYRIAGAPRTWPQLVLASCLSAGPAAAASHLTAGVLHGIVGRKDPPIHVTVPYASKPHPLGFVVHRSRIPFEVVCVGGVRVTCVRRTLLDLAAVLRGRELEEVLDKSLHRGLTTPRDLDEYLTGLGRAAKKGIGRLRALVAQRITRGRHAESVFETRVLRALRDAGLPMPELQYEIRRDGHVVGRVDLCYPQQRVFIELEGWEFHSSRQAFDRGYERRNLIVELGYVPLGFTWTQLDRPRYVADTVRRVLAQRGHPDVVNLRPSPGR